MELKESIKSNIDNPKELELIYRQNKSGFKNEFNSIYPEIKENELAGFWNERLNYESADISTGNKKELGLVLLASLLAAAVIKIPAYLPVDDRFFFMRDSGFAFFPVLIMYFLWKNKIQFKGFVLAAVVLLFSVVYINLLPDNYESHTLKLSCIHLPLFLWSVLGIAYAGGISEWKREGIRYLRYNGDLIVITGVILIAGGILTVLTNGLFSLIDLKIFEFYFQYVAIPGAAAAPVIGTYIIEKNPQLVNRVSPVIARIFSPLVLFTLLVYLTAIIISGKDPYNDREFLIAFNGLLIIVMAIILFSVAETSGSGKNRFGLIILFLLSAVTIIVNGIALSAIVFRISEWGITPNKLAVLGGNLLILINIVIVTYRLYRTLINKDEPEEICKTISAFLPVYGIWTAVVTFLFPVIFNFI